MQKSSELKEWIEIWESANRHVEDAEALFQLAEESAELFNGIRPEYRNRKSEKSACRCRIPKFIVSEK